MIVILNGMPGDGGKKRVYDTGVDYFLEEVGVTVVFMPPFSFSENFEQEAPAFKHEFLMFSYSHFDGTYHNYTIKNTLQCPQKPFKGHL